MGRLCYISRNYRGTESSGNKAKTDNEDTLHEMGAVNLGLPRSLHHSKVLTFILDLAGIIKYVFSVRPGDIVILQYPIKKYFSFVCDIARMRGAHTVSVIHDLGSFRRKKLTVSGEIRRLMHSDFVIASNRVMQKWLTGHGYAHPTGALGLFDYRSAADNTRTATYRRGNARIVYAGALAMRKNSFILNMQDVTDGYVLHIYGNREGLPGLRDSDSMVFHGFTPADDFIRDVDADFGLVWDGDSLDSCTGDFGEYLRYNSPHKVSFYIRAGLPVIIWREAALAEIVEQEHIGICIDSLSQLGPALDSITTADYDAMRANVIRLCGRMNKGGSLRRAVDEACQTIKGTNV